MFVLNPIIIKDLFRLKNRNYKQSRTSLFKRNEQALHGNESIVWEKGVLWDRNSLKKRICHNDRHWMLWFIEELSIILLPGERINTHNRQVFWLIPIVNSLPIPKDSGLFVNNTDPTGSGLTAADNCSGLAPDSLLTKGLLPYRQQM